MDPHGDVGPHLERQKLQDLVLIEAFLSGPGVRHPAFDAVLVGLKKELELGRGGGLMVSILAFYSDGPSSNPASNYKILSK